MQILRTLASNACKLLLCKDSLFYRKRRAGMCTIIIYVRYFADCMAVFC